MDNLPIEVRIVRLPHAADLPLPGYETSGAAGMDVRAAIDDPIEIAPGEISRIPTGWSVEVPPDFEIQLRPRSGLAVKLGVTLPNAPATIDSDYRGEIVVGLINHGTEPFRVERGMRIAQMVLGRVPRILWQEVETLTPSARGEGGFGHTGVR